ncbi:TPA: hypothetical protein EYP66_18780 [Candidatus Poribacteria bacterium]|nr:hypothetical protein [Candidatus Poribacteria bacterium]
MLITDKELEHRLAETFPKLAKKYHISDDVTGALIDELSSALKTPSRQSYETALSYVQQAWDELKKQLDSPMYSIYFDTFAHEVMGLSASTEGLPKYRRYLTAAFAAAVRRSATDGRRLTKQQVEALEATLQELYHSEPSVEILDKCTDALTQAGLDPIFSLGKRTEEFLASMEAEEEEGRIF